MTRVRYYEFHYGCHGYGTVVAPWQGGGGGIQHPWVCINGNNLTFLVARAPLNRTSNPYIDLLPNTHP